MVFDGSFFAVLGFPVSVFCDSSRLGLGFQSLTSFSGMGFAVGKWVSVLFHERGLHSNIFICRGFDFGKLLFVPFLCADFQILCVLSWVACASHVFGGAKSVFYNRHAAWWSFGASAGDVFIGIFCCYSLVHRRSFMSQLESDSGWLLVPTFGGSVTLLGSSSPGDCGIPGSLMRRIPRCLSIVCRLVQRSNSMLILTCHSRRRQKNLFFAREVVGIKLGAQAAGGENDRECSRTGMYLLFLLRMSLHFGL